VWKLCVGFVSAKISRPVDRLKCCDCIEMPFGFVSATFWRPVVRLKCCNYIEMSFRLCIRHITTPCSSNPSWIFGYYVQDMTCCEVAALRNCWGNTAGVSTDCYYFPIFAAATWGGSSHDSEVVWLLLELLGYWISDIYVCVCVCAYLNESLSGAVVVYVLYSRWWTKI